MPPGAAKAGATVLKRTGTPKLPGENTVKTSPTGEAMKAGTCRRGERTSRARR